MRRKQRVGTGRPRRGATLVFVAVFALALVAMAAFAIDLSRLYVGTNELQTGADAAALRGAMELQQNPGQSPSAVAASFASSNQALDSSIALGNGDVWPVYWDDSLRTADTTVAWSAANAVRVTASVPNKLLFGRVLSAVNQTPRRKAIAWIANVSGVRCQFKPFGFPIQNVFEDLGLGAINNRPMTLAEVDQLRDLLATLAGKVQLTQIMYPKDNGITPTNETSIYWPLADNMNQYPDQISQGGGCGANAAIYQGQNETSAFPGSGGGSNAQKAVDGALGYPLNIRDPICGRIADDATCYAPGTSTAGITVTAAYTGGGTNLASCSSSCALPVRMIAGFKIMCIFYGKVTGGGPNGQNNSSERCPWLVNNFSSAYNKSYNTGTIVGYPVVESIGLGPNIDLGNAPSLAQRLILVR